MPPQTGLEFPWEWVFYKDIAPTALGFASKLTTGKTALANGGEHRQEVLLASDIKINRSFSKRKTLKGARRWCGWFCRFGAVEFPLYRSRGKCYIRRQSPFKLMWQSYIYGMHWKHDGKMYYDELHAESKEEAAGYFIENMRDDVMLVRVVLVGPNEGGVREVSHRPDSPSPFRPLVARRRLDKDDNAS